MLDDSIRFLLATPINGLLIPSQAIKYTALREISTDSIKANFVEIQKHWPKTTKTMSAYVYLMNSKRIGTDSSKWVRKLLLP